MVTIVASMCCLESLSQIASEAIWEDLKFSLGRGGKYAPQSTLVATHAYAHYYHPTTILFPPQLKILYETLVTDSNQANLARMRCLPSSDATD